MNRNLNMAVVGTFLLIAPVIARGETYNVSGETFAAAMSAIERTHPVSVTIVGELGSRNLVKFRQLPSSVKSLDLSGLKISGGDIPSYSFMGTEIRDLKLPEGLTEIGEGAFSSTALESVALPSSLKSIGSYAFYKCGGLKSINFPTSIEIVGTKSFMGSAIETADLSNVKAVGDYAFANCGKLASLQLNASSSLGEGAFYGTTSLGGDFVLNSSEALLFAGVDGLGSVRIDSEEVKQGAYAVSGATKLVLGSKVSRIERDAFRGMRNLKVVNVMELKGDVPELDIDGFSDVNVSQVTLQIDNKYDQLWRNAPGWEAFSISTGADGVEIDACEISVVAVSGGIEVLSNYPLDKVEVYDLKGVQLGVSSTKEKRTVIKCERSSPVVVKVQSGGVCKVVRIIK